MSVETWKNGVSYRYKIVLGSEQMNFLLPEDGLGLPTNRLFRNVPTSILRFKRSAASQGAKRAEGLK